MVTDQQVRRLRRLDLRGLPKERAADKAGMDTKTARKYRRLGKLPSEVRRMERDYRTRPDPFAEVWPQREEQLRLNPGLQAKTLFDDLQRRWPGRFVEGQLRTLQRHIKRWRALFGSSKEVFFAQLCEAWRRWIAELSRPRKERNKKHVLLEDVPDNLRKQIEANGQRIWTFQQDVVAELKKEQPGRKLRDVLQGDAEKQKKTAGRGRGKG
jgi:hypothetical protein